MRVLIALLALPLAAQELDPAEALIRLRDRILAHGQRVPNYTCVETVTRDQYEAAITPVPKTCDALLGRRKQTGVNRLLRLATTDRLRLDVTVADNREMMSWAGAPRFDEGEIDELIPDGSMGTGAYASLLLSVFQGAGSRYFLEPESKLNGRAAVEYSFLVPLEESRYRVKAGREWVITSYSGNLWLDPKTADLLRMTVRTDELPLASNSCEAQTTLDYSTVQLGGLGYLLPSKGKQRFILRDGSESDNTIEFASCREFKGESSVRFGASAAAEIRTEAKSAAAAWPAGLPVTVDLDTTVHSVRAAAGDEIEGRLVKAVANAPAGALVHGRLMRVELRHSARPEVTISLRWESVEVDGARVPLNLAPQRTVGDLKNAPQRRLGRIEIVLPPVSDSRYGAYRFPGAQAVMERGYRTEWTTARP